MPILKKFVEDKVFLVVAILTFFCGIVWGWTFEFIDMKVILSLFGLMSTIKSFEHLGVLNGVANFLAKHSSTVRKLTLNMVLLSFFSAMFLTNDVAIITLMPIYLSIIKRISKKTSPILGSILLIVAANLGSTMMPFGNPQNIYLFSYYKYTLIDFFSILFPLLIPSLFFLTILCLFISNQELSFDDTLTSHKNSSKGKLIITTTIFLIMIAYVLHIITSPLLVLFGITCLLFIDKKSLAEVDYPLLATFIGFFLIVGDLINSQWIKSFIEQLVQTKMSTYVSSALISQLISNVPASILLAPFSQNGDPLLLGTNIGGLGTLIASLANLIGFNIFSLYYPKIKIVFVKWFLILNFLLLGVYFLVGWFILS